MHVRKLFVRPLQPSTYLKTFRAQVKNFVSAGVLTPSQGGLPRGQRVGRP